MLQLPTTRPCRNNNYFNFPGITSGGDQTAVAHALFYGQARAPLVRAVPDERYPTMWRLHWPDGRVSDMANLSWIRDAGRVLAARDVADERLLHWERDAHHRRAAASPVRRNALPVGGAPPDPSEAPDGGAP